MGDTADIAIPGGAIGLQLHPTYLTIVLEVQSRQTKSRSFPGGKNAKVPRTVEPSDLALAALLGEPDMDVQITRKGVTRNPGKSDTNVQIT